MDTDFPDKDKKDISLFKKASRETKIRAKVLIHRGDLKEPKKWHEKVKVECLPNRNSKGKNSVDACLFDLMVRATP